MGRLTVVSRPSASLRRTVGLALVAGLLISAVAFYNAALTLPRSGVTATTTGPLSPKQPPTASAIGSPSSASPTAPLNEHQSKRPGTARAGILLTASPLSDGSFDVAEVVLLANPISSLRLSPPDLRLADSRFAQARPVASQVQVSADDQPVMVPGGRLSERVNIALSTPAKRIELRYKLSGITLRSVPSQAGRALSGIGPIVGGVPNSLPVAIVIRGRTVLNIECPTLQASERVCVAGRPPQLHLKRELPWRSAVIVVQFDLPRPQ